MMSNNACENCGTLLLPGAKFCRQCGKPLSDATAAPSVTEATTRVFDAHPGFDTPSNFSSPTQFVNPKVTGPAYMAPGEMSPLQPLQTQGLPRKSHKRQILLIALVLLLLVIPAGALALVFAVSQFSSPSHTTVVEIPEAPEPPEPPEMPDVPPPPDTEHPPLPDGVSAIPASAFLYPGAETIIDINQDDGGRVLQLRTSDAFQKVVDWYASKIKPSKTLRMPGTSAILKGENVTVVITGLEGNTNIMVKEGED